MEETVGGLNDKAVAASLVALLIIVASVEAAYIAELQRRVAMLTKKHDELLQSLRLATEELRWLETGVNQSIPPIIRQISDRITVVVDTWSENFTVKLDPSKEWRVKLVVLRGGSNPHPECLAYPHAPIAFFLIEDMGEPDADNYRDLIIAMNPAIVDGEPIMYVVFFSEGAYIKYVYYDDKLIYKSYDNHKYVYYGIAILPIELNATTPQKP